MKLKERVRILILGGGPAGSFFAIQLLKKAKKLNLSLDVIIIERKSLLSLDGYQWLLEGCNYCAGGISPRLSSILEEAGIQIPDFLIQEEFTHIWIQGLWKNFPLRIPHNSKMYSVFRGTLPKSRKDHLGGFDDFLLRTAVEEGAKIFHGNVQEIRHSSKGEIELIFEDSLGEYRSLFGDFAAVAIGVNSMMGQSNQNNKLLNSIEKIIPGFLPARTRQALVFELKLGKDYLKKFMNKELYFVEYGSKELPLEHIALVPKGEFLTVTLIGKAIDQALLPKESKKIINQFLVLPHIKSILPQLTLENVEVSCTCAPQMTIGPAKNVVGDKIALIGDVMGSRLNKDGLLSAFITARVLAETILHRGINKVDLDHGLKDVIKWLKTDNRYGGLVFRLIRTTLVTSLGSRILYQAFASELKNKTRIKRPLGEVLWRIASGTSDYREIFYKMFSFGVLHSITLGGGLLTIRNILTEKFFGLKWGTYGRYPTVIIKEKRDYIKKLISAPLGIKLNDSPDFERMYIIRIRSKREAIFQELGKFGDQRRDYLKLRFFGVKRIFGEPNQVGSIIQYSIGKSGWPVLLKLGRCLPNRTLLYEVGDRFTKQGKLLFDIHLTRGGNNVLVIYTAFDFRTGKNPISWIFWKLFRVLFPSFVHDIVWNHALCCIKENSELALKNS